MSRQSFLAQHRAAVAQTQINNAEAVIAMEARGEALPEGVADSARDHLPNLRRDLRNAQNS
jgi:hypothetical protein